MSLKEGPVRKFLRERAAIIPRKKLVDLLKGHSSEYDVRYVDLTTGRTQEKRFAEREMYDLYKLQREGKVSIVSIHKVAGSAESPEVIGEKMFYYCDNPRHPHGEVVQVLTYERDPKCPLCLKVMTYGKYWR